MQIHGDKELVRALRALGRGLPTSAVDRAAASSMKPMHEAAVQNARAHRQPGRRPKGGHLDEGIVFRKRKDSRKSKQGYIIGAVNRARKIAHLVEFSVRAHWQPRRFGGIMHPGHPGYPFMRPAFDEHADKTVDRFGRDIWRQFELLVMSLNKSGKRR